MVDEENKTESKDKKSKKRGKIFGDPVAVLDEE
jgi:hypothetical protein